MELCGALSSFCDGQYYEKSVKKALSLFHKTSKFLIPSCSQSCKHISNLAILTLKLFSNSHLQQDMHVCMIFCASMPYEPNCLTSHNIFSPLGFTSYPFVPLVTFFAQKEHKCHLGREANVVSDFYANQVLQMDPSLTVSQEGYFFLFCSALLFSFFTLLYSQTASLCCISEERAMRTDKCLVEHPKGCIVSNQKYLKHK